MGAEILETCDLLLLTTLRSQFYLKCPPALRHSGQCKETSSVKMQRKASWSDQGMEGLEFPLWRRAVGLPEERQRPGCSRTSHQRRGAGGVLAGWLRGSRVRLTAQAQSRSAQARRHLGWSTERRASAHGPRLRGRAAILSQEL